MNQQARLLFLNARILRFCAHLFIVFGVVMFAYLYLSLYHDDPMLAFRDPVFVVCILVPFLPAAVLSFAAAKKEKQARAAAAAQKQASADAAAKPANESKAA